MSNATVAAATAVKNLSGSFSTMDLSKLYDLGPKLLSDPPLLNEFKKTPEVVALREVGLVLPLGTHLHFYRREQQLPPSRRKSC